MSLGLVAPPGVIINEENHLYNKVTWRLMPFLFACYVAAYLDRVNVGFAKLQMLGDLKFSESIYGLALEFFSLVISYLKFPATLSCIRSVQEFGLPGSC